MSPTDVLAGILLAIGVIVQLLCSIGVIAMDDVFDRMHFLSPASVIGPAAIAAAIVVKETVSLASVKAVIVAVLLALTSPILTHATARAGRVRQFGHWRATAGEKVDIE